MKTIILGFEKERPETFWKDIENYKKRIKNGSIERARKIAKDYLILHNF